MKFALILLSTLIASSAMANPNIARLLNENDLDCVTNGSEGAEHFIVSKEDGETGIFFSKPTGKAVRIATDVEINSNFLVISAELNGKGRGFANSKGEQIYIRLNPFSDGTYGLEAHGGLQIRNLRANDAVLCIFRKK